MIGLVASISACGGGEPPKKPAKSSVDVPPATAESHDTSDQPPRADVAPPKKKIPECRSDPDPEVARKEYEIALAEFDRGNYPVAAEGFTRAYVRS